MTESSVSIRVLVVEDDDDLREEIVIGLKAQDIEPNGVPDGSALYRELLKQQADIIVLDVGLPGESGTEIARHLRSSSPTKVTGIIMLTGQGALSDKVHGLQSGADVYLTKPICVAELSAYVRSLYRRIHATIPASRTPSWKLLMSQWRVISPSGEEETVSHHESVVLEVLVRHAGQVVQRRDLIAALGQDPLTYDDRRLEAIVSRLRKKLHRIHPLSQPLRAAHGSGYIFCEPIEFAS